MRLSVAASALIFAFGSAGHASAAVEVLAENALRTPSTSAGRIDGTFSDAMSSDGLYYYSQALGQSFSLSQGARLSSLTVWGSSEDIDGTAGDLLSANITALEVSILQFGGASTDYPAVVQWTVPMIQVVQLDAGWDVSGILRPALQLDIPLDGGISLDAGNYILTVGAVQDDPDGDSFVWLDGVGNGSLASSYSYLTVGDVAAQWGYWDPVEANISGSMVLYGIPGPGTLALMALAGTRKGRRRR